MKHTTFLMIATLLLAGCQSTLPQSHTQARVAAPVLPAEPPPLIRVYTVDGRPVDTDQEANEAAARALEKTVSLQAKEIALKDAIQLVRNTTGLSVAVNWNAINAADITRADLLQMQAGEWPVRQFLVLVLQHASVELFEDEQLDYAIREGMVYISTTRDLKAKSVSRVYSLDWFANHKPSLNKQVYGRNNEARRVLGMTTLQQKTVDPAELLAIDLNPGFCANCDKKHDRLEVALQVLTYYEKVEQIIELIQTTVGDPDEWLDEDSTLMELNGMLIVKTSPENQDHIHRLFESMRLERARKFKEQALEMEVALLLEAAESARLKQDYNTALNKINQALRVAPPHLEARALNEIVSATLSR